MAVPGRWVAARRAAYRRIPSRTALRRALRLLLLVGGVVALPIPDLPVRVAGVLALCLGATLPIWSAPHHGAPQPLRLRQWHRRVVARVAWAPLGTAAGLAVAQGRVTALDGWLCLAASALPAMEPLLWRTWPRPLREAARRTRNAELYTEAMQAPQPPPAPGVTWGEVVDERRARENAPRREPWRPGLNDPRPRPVKVAPVPPFDVDAGAGGRPRPYRAEVRSGVRGPVEVRAGRARLRWTGAQLDVTLRRYGVRYRLLLAPEPVPPDLTRYRFPRPVAELVLYTERPKNVRYWRELYLVLLDAQGCRILLLRVFSADEGKARALAASLEAAVGLVVNGYHLPQLDGARRPLSRRLFPRRRRAWLRVPRRRW